ncbi:MAG TPA: iron-sulfur cluster repair di-iron protein [Saprospirales bacterium]|nr:iron-sulfur cluster repair di-iron protein [Saprospirales bacterium]
MVVADYRKAEVFRKFGIDYCCGGKKPLADVCRQKQLDLQTVQQALDAIDKQPAAPHQNFTDLPLDMLVDHIVTRHHQYVEASLPVLDELTAKVARVHGERHPELMDIARQYLAVAQELRMHMHKEERVLFPYIRQMEQSRRTNSPRPVPVFGSVANPIHMMEAEHESAGEAMEAIRKLSNQYTPPQDACTSYRVLFAKLQEFEQDLHQHVHLENNILFPKAKSLEMN